ncbi:hypothetical protein LTR10_018954 [Elasticomyces elasticus]|uniref:Uncharacterized protein n=1 Tax=Exophiala sideris TaxID=1016849 RepID=A0A0D1X265_9EURO|nr:hypothetical protein LTR10_018954 [Elasticomyces elasticus]KAK5022292.1 hypothetical protein LTS07_010168 [Exophiala sideris]KAK5177644.1 hypothetical protein LTR44_009834 [Eurotiomycetes sp. CCFEE 6388]KAK5027104.1 hypothetical protein LTR13_009714 [Exophiala sideris]KAK5051679.1 hypothetical protein LTR69_010179 [Exophiala sideris]
MSSPSWQDRRFMFPAGREVHQGSRRYSGSKDSDTDMTLSPTVSNTGPPPPAPTPATELPPDLEPASPGRVHPPWEGDRRFMFPAGKEVHQPAVRRGSQSSEKSAGSPGAVRTSASPPASSGGGIAAALAGRRRSSASNQGVFSGLMGTRSGKEHYDDRRQGWDDMKSPGGIGGFFSGLVNKPADKK